MPEASRINPQITSFDIGTRTLRTIKIYPASFGDQLELTDLITKTVQHFFSSREELEEKNDIEMVHFFVELFRENFAKIIDLVTYNEEDILKQVTNSQIIELAEIVYEMNYGDSLKKVQSLFMKIQKAFQKRP